eukprot:682351-Prymnesium_polylepis.1
MGQDVHGAESQAGPSHLGKRSASVAELAEDVSQRNRKAPARAPPPASASVGGKRKGRATAVCAVPGPKPAAKPAAKRKR